jgi:hypothetical protein
MSEAEPIDAHGHPCDVRVPGHVVWHDVDADLVVFNAHDGTYHALDRAGSEVWRAVAREPRLDAVVAELRRRYPDAADVIAQDVRAFVNRAARLGLLVISIE